jgi:spoIIIJ-associated protein
MERVIEARGKDVETAVEIGLATLRAKRGDVTIDIIDEGSRGLLGIGSRDAVVKLTLLTPPAPVKVPVAPEPKPVAVPEAPVAVVEEVVVKEEPEIAAVVAETAESTTETVAETGDQAITAVDIIETLLQKMQVKATITTSLSEPDDMTGEQIDVIEINGDDLGTLIGPRGDTLNALQYVARLIVSHQLQQRADFVIDIQGYRQRRQEALARLAERMAKKAISQGRSISLEPMPPHERRAVHIALRDDKDVYTESTGEGNRRKVRIIPK